MLEYDRTDVWHSIDTNKTGVLPELLLVITGTTSR